MQKKMGFWDKFYKAAKKTITNFILTFTAYEFGDNGNDNEKITNALVKYQNDINVQSMRKEEKSEVLEYTVFSLFVIVIIFIIAIGFKLFANRAVQIERDIILTTINKNNNNNQSNNQIEHP